MPSTHSQLRSRASKSAGMMFDRSIRELLRAIHHRAKLIPDRQMYKEKTGSIRDPLDVARERKGLPAVRI